MTRCNAGADGCLIHLWNLQLDYLPLLSVQGEHYSKHLIAPEENCNFGDSRRSDAEYHLRGRGGVAVRFTFGSRIRVPGSRQRAFTEARR